jgi:hypothetical protein
MKNVPTFNVLSLGHRGVGKTVFLAGSYAELRSSRQLESRDVWFEGANRRTDQTVEKLLGYMMQTGHYPPATMKMTDFVFSAKAREGRHERTLCQFHWADIPGEVCRIDNPDFEAMLLNSHGCCVFIDADLLVKDAQYRSQLEDTIKQVEAIAALAQTSGLQYIFALILTKCDLLAAGPRRLIQIEQKLRSLMTRLDTANILYRRFYSSISIVPTSGTSVVKVEGASVPILWLAAELSKMYQAQAPQNLRSCFEQPLPKQQIDSPSQRSVSSSRRTSRLGAKVLTAIGATAAVAGLWMGLAQLQSHQKLEPLSDTQEQGVSKSYRVDTGP